MNKHFWLLYFNTRNIKNSFWFCLHERTSKKTFCLTCQEEDCPPVPASELGILNESKDHSSGIRFKVYEQ